jgi:hypothetical protein
LSPALSKDAFLAAVRNLTAICARPSPAAPRLQQQPGRTSITDDSKYLDFCAQAAVNPEVFASFRREPVVVQTLEHVTEAQGLGYLEAIDRHNPELLAHGLDGYRRNDSVGNPVTFEYPSVGRFSPVTLRYLKVMSDLQHHFVSLHGMRVVEIGVGYGGQCRLICQRWKLERYTLIDLRQPLELTKRYLASLGSTDGVDFVTPDEVTPGAFDLCISNYAFSELTRVVQDRYADAVIRNSSRGYLTCNFISNRHEIDSWTRLELEALGPSASWVPEEPLTFAGNAILIWGNDISGPDNRLGAQ